ncbi:serine hydrolase [Fibrobacterota bacterium]
MLLFRTGLRRNRTRLLFFLLLGAGLAWRLAFSQKPVALPQPVPDSQFVPLRESISEELTEKLNEIVYRNKTWKKLVSRRKMAVGVVRLTDTENPETAWINPNLTMYAASLPKIGILLAAMQEIEDGGLKESTELTNDLTDMIRKSDNQTATRVIDRIGLKKIRDVLTSPQFEFYNEEKGGGLWIGKRFAKQGRRFGDPMKNLAHAANVRQVCRFYYLLITGRIISRKRSNQILNILSHPEIEHKFVKSLGMKYPLKRLFRKSGTWKHWHSDSVLVWGKTPDKRYILVALIESPDGEQILRDLAQQVDNVFTGY